MNKIIPKDFSDSANSAGEGGNTSTPSKKQVSPSLRWIFTLNNYTEEEYSAIKEMVIYKCRYAIIGREHTNLQEYGLTPHLQGYIEFKKKARPIAIFGFISTKIRWAKAKGNRHKQDYCEKEGDFWKYPDPYKTEIKNFYWWQKDIIKELSRDADDRTINWIWETEGCAGKTVFQKWIHQRYKDVLVLSGKQEDMKNGIIQWHNATSRLPKIILINIPRVACNHVSIAGIESVKDMFFFCGKYEGGMVNGANPHVYVFANQEPCRFDMSEDRWNIRNIQFDRELKRTVLEEMLRVHSSKGKPPFGQMSSSLGQCLSAE